MSFRRLAKEYAELGKVVDLYRRLKKLEKEIKRSQHLLDSEEDEEMKRLAQEEVSSAHPGKGKGRGGSEDGPSSQRP